MTRKPRYRCGAWGLFIVWQPSEEIGDVAPFAPPPGPPHLVSL